LAPHRSPWRQLCCLCCDTARHTRLQGCP
jgi:hypothetical protein